MRSEVVGSLRRGVAAAVVLAALLAGYGHGDQAGPDTGVGDTEVATGGRLFSTADQATAELGSDAGAGAFPRTVKHALGETKLEKKPERVVVLDTQDVQDLAVEISEENIGQAVGDRIFYSSYGSPDSTAEKVVVAGNLWKSLPTVKAGKVARVDDEVWFLGLGPIGALATLADLERLLATN